MILLYTRVPTDVCSSCSYWNLLNKSSSLMIVHTIKYNTGFLFYVTRESLFERSSMRNVPYLRLSVGTGTALYS